MPKSSYSILDNLKNKTKIYLNEKRRSKIKLKNILKRIFLKPPFIGEIILIILLMTSWLWTLTNAVSLSDLGSIAVSISNDQQIEEYKSNVANGIISQLKEKGIDLSNLSLTEDDVKKFAGVSMLKTYGDENKEEGKNLVYNGSKSAEGKVQFTRNETKEYNYLDIDGNTKKITYTSTYINIFRTTQRYKAVAEELNKMGKKYLDPIQESDLVYFEPVLSSSGEEKTSETLEIAINHIIDPFLVKHSIPMYLYTSTYDKELCNKFVDDEVFNSEIILEEVGGTAISCGLPKAPEIRGVFGIDFNKDSYDSILKLVKNDNFIDIVIQKIDSEEFIFDSGKIQNQNGIVVGTYWPANLKTPDNKEYILRLLSSKQCEENKLESTFSDELKKNSTCRLVVRDKSKITVYEGKEQLYQTYCKTEMPIYLLKEAKTWFGIFEFENEITSTGNAYYIYDENDEDISSGGGNAARYKY